MTQNLNAYCTERNANTINVKTFVTLMSMSFSCVDHYNMGKKVDIAENALVAFPFIGSYSYSLTPDLKNEFFSNSATKLKEVLEDTSGIIRFTYECLLIKQIKNVLSLDLNSDDHEIDWANLYSKENGFKLDKITKEQSDSIKRDMAVALDFYINTDYAKGFNFKLNRAVGYLRGFMLETTEDAAILGSFIQFNADVKLQKILKIIINHNKAIMDLIMIATTAVDSIELPVKRHDD